MGIANVIAGVVILLLGSIVIYLANQLPYEAEYGPGPGFLPFWIGICLTACGMLAMFEAVRKYGRTDVKFFQPRTGRVLFVLTTLIITFFLVPALGLSLGLALFTAFTMRTSGRHGWRLCILVAVLTAASVRIIFGYFLDIPLPKGYFGI